MADENRRYAEDLLGPLDRSIYNKQGEAIQQAGKTRWDSLSNQFQNLKNQLEAQRATAQTAYQKGLSDAMEQGYDYSRATDANMVAKGLGSSGLQNLADVQTTTAKGQQVNALLSNLSKVAAQNAQQLEGAGTQMSEQQRGINASLATDLGRVGAADIGAQMEYNQAAAGLASAKEERDMENELARMQRASRGGGGGTDPEVAAAESELEALYRNAERMAVLQDPDMTDEQKANYMRIMLGDANPESIIKTYKGNLVQSKINYKQILKDVGIKAYTEAATNPYTNEYYAPTASLGSVLDPNFGKDLPKSILNNKPTYNPDAKPYQYLLDEIDAESIEKMLSKQRQTPDYETLQKLLSEYQRKQRYRGR